MEILLKKKSINANNIFDFWESDLIDRYSLIKDNKNYFSDSKYCLAESLTSDNILKREQKCHGCNIISRLIYGPKLESSEIEILIGKNRGKIIKYISKDFFNENYKKDKYLKKFSNKLTKYLSFFYKDEFFSINNIDYYVINNRIYNKSTISIIMKNISIKKKFPLTNDFIWSHKCGNKINLLYMEKEYRNIKDLSDDPAFNNSFSPVSKKTNKNYLSHEIVFDIFKQAIFFLKFFSYFYFTHNELSSEFISFSSILTSFQYDGKKLESPIRMYINSSVYSSISIYNKEKNLWSRFSFQEYTDINNIHTMPLEKIDIDFNGSTSFINTSFKLPYIKEYEQKRLVFYKIGKDGENFLKLRRKGLPICSRSFDIITLLISLLIIENFRKSFLEDVKLSSIWKNLWKLDEFEILMKDIIKTNDNKFKNVFRIIRKYHIRFDALDYLFNSI